MRRLLPSALLPTAFLGAVAPTAFLGAVALAMPSLALAAEEAGAGEAAAEAVHVDWVGIGLHLFNLALLLVVIGYFARKKIRDALADRTAEIKRDIDESNRLRKESRERFEEIEARIAGFEQRIAGMKAQAELDATEERQAIMERADRELVRLQESTERTIRSETAKARMALRRDAVALAMELAEDRIAANVGASDDQRLAEDFFQEIGTAKGVTHG